MCSRLKCLCFYQLNVKFQSELLLAIMLRHYTRAIGYGIRNQQFQQKSNQILTQFNRNYGDGKVVFM